MKKIVVSLICIGFLFSFAAEAQKKQKPKKRTLVKSTLKQKLPTKSTLKVLILGHTGHGKSTLTAAITKVLSKTGRAKLKTYNKIVNAPETNLEGTKLQVARVEYESDKARYIHFDCQNDDCYTNFLSTQSKQLAGLIMVVDVTDGPMPQTRHHLELAEKYGIKSIVVYLNKIDLIENPELTELAELETRELLYTYGFKGDDVEFIKGSALMALKGTKKIIGKDSIIKLLKAMDKSFVK